MQCGDYTSTMIARSRVATSIQRTLSEIQITGIPITGTPQCRSAAMESENDQVCLTCVSNEHAACIILMTLHSPVNKQRALPISRLATSFPRNSPVSTFSSSLHIWRSYPGQKTRLLRLSEHQALPAQSLSNFKITNLVSPDKTLLK